MKSILTDFRGAGRDGGHELGAIWRQLFRCPAVNRPDRRLSAARATSPRRAGVDHALPGARPPRKRTRKTREPSQARAPRSVHQGVPQGHSPVGSDQRQLDGRYLPRMLVVALVPVSDDQPDGSSALPQRQITSPLSLAPGVKPTRASLTFWLTSLP